MDAAGICQDHIAAGQEIVEIQHFQRLNDADPFLTTQNFIGSLPHHRIHVDGIDGLHIGMLIHDAPDCPKHIFHGLAQIFPPMGGDQDQTAVSGPFQFRVGVVLPDGGFQGVDHGISGDINGRCRFALPQQVVFCHLGRRKMITTDNATKFKKFTDLMGGTPEQCFEAAAITIGNMLGLVCDPIAGLVEAPCQSRNAAGASNALTSAEMALAGIRSAIPFSEMVDAMYRVGKKLPMELRETALGGCAATPTGCALKCRIFG